MISDEEADRIESNAARADRETLLRFVRDLLADRRTRIALLQGESRRVAYARKRLAQATRYLDGILDTAAQDTGAPWPGQLACRACGAPARQTVAEARPEGGHRLVTIHPDGRRCVLAKQREPAGHGSAARTPEKP